MRAVFGHSYTSLSGLPPNHSTSLIPNLTCLELSGLRGGRSSEIFWDYLYTTFVFRKVVSSPLSAACDLGQAVFSSSNCSHFYYMQTHHLSVARRNLHYKSKFLGGRTFQSICGNTGGLGVGWLVGYMFFFPGSELVFLEVQKTGSK